jgi:hypothetical protein
MFNLYLPKPWHMLTVLSEFVQWAKLNFNEIWGRNPANVVIKDFKPVWKPILTNDTKMFEQINRRPKNIQNWDLWTWNGFFFWKFQVNDCDRFYKKIGSWTTKKKIRFSSKNYFKVWFIESWQSVSFSRRYKGIDS